MMIQPNREYTFFHCKVTPMNRLFITSICLSCVYLYLELITFSSSKSDSLFLKRCQEDKIILCIW